MTDIFQSLGIHIPIIQAPMAGVDNVELAVAVSDAGGLGSLACALLSPDHIRAAWAEIQKCTAAPVNLNFFCHEHAAEDSRQQDRWAARLKPYYEELGLDIHSIPSSATRAPFDETFCEVVEDIKPRIMSFHFGLPRKDLVGRVKRSGAVILSSATTLEEALLLERNGCDVIIAQGAEAGGHRAMFMNDDIKGQQNLLPLLKSIVKNVSVPVVAAGGIANAQGIKEALDMGAVAVQLGTAYLFCVEANVSPLYREALASDAVTDITNIFSGRPARGIVNRLMSEVGPMSKDAPSFPYASKLINPLRKESERRGVTDLMQMWSGTRRVPHEMDAATLTKTLYEEFKTLG